jgi:hypothetical protein
MITTINNHNLTASQLCRSLKHFEAIGKKIERDLKLPTRYNLLMSIQPHYARKGSPNGTPEVKFFVTGRCEIVSLEPVISEATRIVAEAQRAVIFPDKVSEKDLAKIVRDLKKQARQAGMQ